MDTAPHYDHTGDTQRKPQGWPCDSIPHQDVGRSSREERSEGTHFALGPGHRLHAGGGWPGSESPEDRRASLGCLSRETGRPGAAGHCRPPAVRRKLTCTWLRHYQFVSYFWIRLSLTQTPNGRDPEPSYLLHYVAERQAGTTAPLESAGGEMRGRQLAEKVEQAGWGAGADSAQVWGGTARETRGGQGLRRKSEKSTGSGN